MIQQQSLTIYPATLQSLSEYTLGWPIEVHDGEKGITRILEEHPTWIVAVFNCEQGFPAEFRCGEKAPTEQRWLAEQHMDMLAAA